MVWYSIVFMQGDEADEVFAMLYQIDGVVWSGPYAESINKTVEYLAQWDYGDESEHSPYTDIPWGTDDKTETVEYAGTEYVLAWNSNVGYVSLNRKG